MVNRTDGHLTGMIFMILVTTGAHERKVRIPLACAVFWAPEIHMKLSEIKELISLVDESGLIEFEYETAEGEKLVMRKTGETVHTERIVSESQCLAEPDAVHSGDREETAGQTDSLLPGQFTIVSPMVGTFYRAPAPDSKAFVDVGDVVEPGQTVCIVEAMKLMNEIEAERRGRIIKILVDNEEPVEYGQPLFVLQDA